jgi:serine/threonine protein kinase/Leucine-rich repeat (LRR) protein
MEGMEDGDGVLGSVSPAFALDAPTFAAPTVAIDAPSSDEAIAEPAADMSTGDRLSMDSEDTEADDDGKEAFASDTDMFLNVESDEMNVDRRFSLALLQTDLGPRHNRSRRSTRFHIAQVFSAAADAASAVNSGTQTLQKDGDAAGAVAASEATILENGVSDVARELDGGLADGYDDGDDDGDDDAVLAADGSALRIAAFGPDADVHRTENELLKAELQTTRAELAAARAELADLRARVQQLEAAPYLSQELTATPAGGALPPAALAEEMVLPLAGGDLAATPTGPVVPETPRRRDNPPMRRGRVASDVAVLVDDTVVSLRRSVPADRVLLDAAVLRIAHTVRILDGSLEALSGFSEVVLASFHDQELSPGLISRVLVEGCRDREALARFPKFLMACNMLQSLQVLVALNCDFTGGLSVDPSPFFHIEGNPSLRRLELRSSQLSVHDVRAVLDSMERHLTLTSLDFRRTHVDDTMAQRLALSLRRLPSLVSLNLESCGMTDEAVAVIASAVGVSRGCAALVLDCNFIGERGGAALGRALSMNQTLTSLSLSSMTLDRGWKQGFAAFVRGLHRNAALVSLSVANNAFSLQLIIRFAEMLMHNTALQVLNWNFNCVNAEFMERLTASLRFNVSLHSLFMRGSTPSLHTDPNILELFDFNHVLRCFSVDKRSKGALVAGQPGGSSTQLASGSGSGFSGGGSSGGNSGGGGGVGSRPKILQKLLGEKDSVEVKPLAEPSYEDFQRKFSSLLNRNAQVLRSRESLIEEIHISRLRSSRDAVSLATIDLHLTDMLQDENKTLMMHALGLDDAEASAILGMIATKWSASEGSVGTMLAPMHVLMHENRLKSVPVLAVLNTSMAKHLTLSNNRLTSLSHDSLLRLTSLTSLDLRNNRIPAIPSSLAQLKSLSVLLLDGNLIESVPPAVLRLSSLSTLTLERNPVPDSVIRMCRRMCRDGVLDLAECSGEGILPVELFEFTWLRDLRLAHNELTTLPPVISQLTSLSSLDLEYNQLNSLPWQLGTLTNLRRLQLTGNPLSILNTRSKMDVTATLSYLRGLKSATVDLCRVKLMIVGPENVGKTSLLQNFRDLIRRRDGASSATPLFGLSSINDNQSGGSVPVAAGGTAFSGAISIPSTSSSSAVALVAGSSSSYVSTHGIEVERFALKCGAHEVDVAAWDFGGQEVYLPTHEFFMSKRSVFLLVFNMTMLDQLQRLNYWLANIRLRAPDCPALVVGTYSDEKMCTPDYVRMVGRRVKSQLDSKFGNVLGFYPLSNTRRKSVESALDALRKTIADLPFLVQQVPSGVLSFENQLSMIASQRPYPLMDWSEYSKLAVECGVSADQVHHITAYLNDVGSLFYVLLPDHDFLASHVVLRVSWIIGLFRMLIGTQSQFIKNGLLKESNVAHIWKGLAEDEDVREMMLVVLENVELIYRISRRSALRQVGRDLRRAALAKVDPPEFFSGRSVRIDVRNVIVVPALLSTKKPNFSLFGLRWGRDKFFDLASNPACRVIRIFQFDTLPVSLFPRLLVRILSRPGLQPLYLWRHGVVVCGGDGDGGGGLPAQSVGSSSDADSEGTRARSTTLLVLEEHVQSSSVNVVVFGQHPGQLSCAVEDDIEHVVINHLGNKYRVMIPCRACLESEAHRKTPSLVPLSHIMMLISRSQTSFSCPNCCAVVPLEKLVPDIFGCEVQDYVTDWSDVQLGDRLVRGLKSDIFKATYNGETVVVKRAKLDEDASAQEKFGLYREYASEGWLLSRLASPHLVRLRGILMNPYALILEYFPAGSLADLLSRRFGDLTLEGKMVLAVDVARGMQYLHRATPPILHRDLKSGNVLLWEDGKYLRGCISDFGSSIAFMGSNRVVDNPRWLASEVIAGKDYTSRSDVYAFAVLLWEIFVGEVPFSEYHVEFLAKLEQRIINGLRPSLPRQAPPAVCSLIQRCWSPDTSERPTFSTIVSELEKIWTSMCVGPLPLPRNPAPASAVSSSAQNRLSRSSRRIAFRRTQLGASLMRPIVMEEWLQHSMQPGETLPSTSAAPLVVSGDEIDVVGPLASTVAVAMGTMPPTIAGDESEVVSVRRRSASAARDSLARKLAAPLLSLESPLPGPAGEKDQQGALVVTAMGQVAGHVWVGYSNGDVRVYSASGSFLRQFAAHPPHPVLAIHELGGHAWTGGGDHLVRRWNPVSEALEMLLYKHRGSVTGLAGAQGMLYTTSEDCSVRLWHLSNGVCSSVVSCDEPVLNVSATENFVYLRTATGVIVMDSRAPRRLAEHKLPLPDGFDPALEGPAAFAVVDAASDVIAVAGAHGVSILRGTAAPALLPGLDLPAGGAVSVASAGEEATLWILTAAHDLVLYHGALTRLVRRVALGTNGRPLVVTVLPSPRAALRHLWVGTSDGVYFSAINAQSGEAAAPPTAAIGDGSDFGGAGDGDGASANCSTAFISSASASTNMHSRPSRWVPARSDLVATMRDRSNLRLRGNISTDSGLLLGSASVRHASRTVLVPSPSSRPDSPEPVSPGPIPEPTESVPIRVPEPSDITSTDEVP